MQPIKAGDNGFVPSPTVHPKKKLIVTLVVLAGVTATVSVVALAVLIPPVGALAGAALIAVAIKVSIGAGAGSVLFGGVYKLNKPAKPEDPAIALTGKIHIKVVVPKNPNSEQPKDTKTPDPANPNDNLSSPKDKKKSEPPRPKPPDPANPEDKKDSDPKPAFLTRQLKPLAAEHNSMSKFQTLKKNELKDTDPKPSILQRPLQACPADEDYDRYNDRILASNNHVLSSYPDNVIQVCSNYLHPSIRLEVNIPKITNGKYTLINEPIFVDPLSGLCAGMCFDHMNRFRFSTKQFFEALNEVGLKFNEGCTKEGYLYQYQLECITISEKYKLRKAVQVMAKFYMTGIDDEETYCNRFQNILKAKKYNFFTQGYKCKFYGFKEFNTLSEGDYFLSIRTDVSGHLINLFKRREGTAIFDPNFGTLFFKEEKSYVAYIEKATKSLYPDQKVSFNLFLCKDLSKV